MGLRFHLGCHEARVGIERRFHEHPGIQNRLCRIAAGVGEMRVATQKTLCGAPKRSEGSRKLILRGEAIKPFETGVEY